MATEVIMPKVDMDMATGKISKWFFKDGDAVAKGDVLFEIETDKAAMEIDSPAAGILRSVIGAEGVDIAVGSAVAWIYAEGEVAAAPAAANANPAPAAAVDEKVEAFNERVEALAVFATSDGSTRATPLARRLARDAGLDLSMISGSGPKGRIVGEDVKKASAANAEVASVASCRLLPTEPAAPAEKVPDNVLKQFPEGSYDLQPHTPMRRTIARRLVEAKSTVPHFYLTVDCRLDALLKLRIELNAAAPSVDGAPAYKLSVNDMVIKAYALALATTPDANVSWTDDQLVRHRFVDVGVAVSVPGGLITPIIRGAQSKSLSTISNEMKELAGRAKAGRLKPEEYQGGTGAVSNLGMFGIREFAAIVNPPHSTILAVGTGERRAVVGEGDALGAATVMTVTLSTDHRAVDGALGAELIGKFRAFIENPMSMLV